SAGNVLASGLAGSNVDSGLSDLLIATDGTYYVRVAGSGTVTYDLVVTKDAEFSLEPNSTTAQAQVVLSRQTGGDQWLLGHVGATGDGLDYYKVNLAAGATLTAQTFTPAGGTGQFVNTLDPRLRVLNSVGSVVATNENSAPDGRNALVSYSNS